MEGEAPGEPFLADAVEGAEMPDDAWFRNAEVFLPSLDPHPGITDHCGGLFESEPGRDPGCAEPVAESLHV